MAATVMHPLSRLRLRTRLILLTGLCALAFVMRVGVASSMMHQRRIDDRIDKLRASCWRHAASPSSSRYGGPDDRLLAQTYDGMVLLHGGDPKREGMSTTAKDARRRSSAELARIALRDSDSGVIADTAARPGETL
jgi:hypothetical protein